MLFSRRGLLLSFFALALLFSFVSAIDVDPKQVGSATVDAKLNWDVDMAGQSYSSAAFATFGFFTTAKQSVQFTSSHSFETSVDDFANQILKFQLRPAEPIQRIVMQASLRSNAEGPREAITENIERFSTDSDLVKLSTSVRTKAAEVVGSETNPLRKAALLTSWVHNNIVYDLAYQDRILNSESVFEVRRGVCNEFSHLLLAMLRSQRIPARFVAGYVYSGEIWAPHAWVEIAIGDEWYPFDPTYNEGIVLDGTHFKFAQGLDQSEIKEQFFARGVNFNVSKVAITRSQEFSFKLTSNFTIGPTANIRVPSEPLGENEIFNVTVTMRNDGQYAVAYPVALGFPSDLKLLSQKTYLVYLLPGESQEINFTFLTPRDLRENFIYTYPLVLRSLGASVQSSIQATKSAPSQGQSQATLRISEIRFQSTENKLIVTLQNIGNVAFENAIVSIEVNNETQQKMFFISAGESKELEFPLNLNLSAGESLEGVLVLNTTLGSVSQGFTLEQPVAVQEPTRPAFNIETTRQIGNGQSHGIGQLEIPALVALVATVLIVLVTIISKISHNK